MESENVMNNRELEQLKLEYLDYAEECEYALNIALARIENLRKRTIKRKQRFGAIFSRIKDFDHCVEKCGRKGYDLTIESIRKNIQDVAGIRIITTFQDDVYRVADAIRHSPGINIQEEEDYIKFPKKNGYRSLHMIAFVEVVIDEISRIAPIEIQIRDKAMDLWASVEHIIKYKCKDPNKISEEVEQRFSEIAEMLADFDERAILLRDQK